jgi:hypothetical protein
MKKALKGVGALLGKDVSDSEVARLALAMGLDSIEAYPEDIERPLDADPRAALIKLVAVCQAHQTPTMAQWRWLARESQKAYRLTSLRSDSAIGKDQLSANLHAFVTALGYATVSNDDRQYFAGNLRLDHEQDFGKQIDGLLQGLPDLITTGFGNYGSRNLDVLLRNGKFANEVSLRRALLPFFEPLLRTALWAYFNENDSPIHAISDKAEFLPVGDAVQNKSWLMMPVFRSDSLSFAVTSVRGDWSIGVNHYPEIVQMQRLLAFALNDRTKWSEISRFHPFTLLWAGGSKDNAMLDMGRVRIYLKHDEIADLKKLIDEFLTRPELTHFLQDAPLNWGSI